MKTTFEFERNLNIHDWFKDDKGEKLNEFKKICKQELKGFYPEVYIENTANNIIIRFYNEDDLYGTSFRFKEQDNILIESVEGLIKNEFKVKKLDFKGMIDYIKKQLDEI